MARSSAPATAEDVRKSDEALSFAVLVATKKNIPAKRTGTNEERASNLLTDNKEEARRAAKKRSIGKSNGVRLTFTFPSTANLMLKSKSPTRVAIPKSACFGIPNGSVVMGRKKSGKVRSTNPVMSKEIL